ncbi:putative hydrolase YugF [Vitis vinifera]|uniref:Putative hydrolase YugF n=2 Tax=Vitis vinifera TaxID=29760 RepID=A0A438J102_VITVI|nr:putative hydrolase YugF [Vitis vinifera]
MFTLVAGSVPAGLGATAKCGSLWQFRATADVFPSFIPKEVERIKDPFARKLATRIERLPVQVKSTGVFGALPLNFGEFGTGMATKSIPISLMVANRPCLTMLGPTLESTAVSLNVLLLTVKRITFNEVGMPFSREYENYRKQLGGGQDIDVGSAANESILIFPLLCLSAFCLRVLQLSSSNSCIMSSCVKPLSPSKTSPVVLLHGFDSSCLEWRYTYPLLEEAGLETWAVDILGWGFSDLERLPSCDVATKRDHFYQLWKSHIKRPMILVGPSLGAAVAIDFTANHPEAVDKLVLIDASVYTEGTGNLMKLPRAVAYAGVYILKSIPLRFYANVLAFKSISFTRSSDWTKVGRLHCLYPWWEDATVNFMISGGYNVSSQIQQVKKKTLIIWGEDDQIISNKLAVRLHCELPNAIISQIPDCGHLPHVEKPHSVSKLIMEFVQEDSYKEAQCISQY